MKQTLSRVSIGALLALGFSLLVGHLAGRAILRSNFENFVRSSLSATTHEQNTLDLSAYSRLLYALVQSSGHYSDTSVVFCRENSAIAFAPSSGKSREETGRCLNPVQSKFAEFGWLGVERFKYLTAVPRLADSVSLIVATAPRVINPYSLLIALVTIAACLSVFAARERARFRLKLIAADATLGKVAAQVAHDIRSPLAALESVESEMKVLPEESRVLIRSAIGRIKDIANGLLETNRQARGGGKASAQLLSSMVDVLVSEKRLQYRSRLGIEIGTRFGIETYGLFAEIDSAAFKRVLSNLINNSVEAIAGSGTVTVELDAREGCALVTVADNGKGIAKELQEKLEQGQVTRGKKEGSGIGLRHAKEAVESWGGALRIASKEHAGTRVTLKLPLTSAPEWFVPKLELKAGTHVAILDDDVSIHQIWRGRFEMANARARGVVLQHFSAAAELANFAASMRTEPMLCLVDYELLGEDRSGLDVIASLGIAGRSILVTSRFEEPEVRARCARLGMRLIPKGMAALVPIAVASLTPHADAQKFDAVLIDDEDLVHATWRITAKRDGKRVLLCKSFEEFFERSGALDRATAIYVDVSLGRGVRGEDVSKRVVDAGFANVYLSTGHRAEQFAHLAWLKGVVGKEPPWLVE